MTVELTSRRVLANHLGRPKTLAEHEDDFGPINRLAISIDVLRESGITGRGGAAFPTAKKVEFLLQQRRATGYVVVNAMEGEPAAHKDRMLLATNPHLVLDGAMVLANLLNADSVVICIARDHVNTIAQVKAAIAQRGARRLQGPSFEVQSPPGRYVAGEESALVHWLNSNETLPQYRPTRPALLQIGRGGVLLDNAETHANIGLIARHGGEWFRSVGTATRPGTTITSITGNGKALVVEVPYGTPIRSILLGAGIDYVPRALLLGGYGGTWLDGQHLDVGFDDDSLRPFGAGTGAGVIMALPPQSCGVAECARIVEYMAKESARQCGPCAFGLPAMAEDLKALASGRNAAQSLARLSSRSDVIEGRGACRHPDGVIRFVRTALSVFAEDFNQHAAGHPCQFALSPRVSYIPHQSDVKDLEWE